MKIAFVLLALATVGCQGANKDSRAATYPDVQVVGAMRNVMWNGQLEGSIDLDTLSEKKGLYGLGPVSDLAGEVLINDGKCYVSKVSSPSTMDVAESFDVSAPFFVYAQVREWDQVDVPSDIVNIQDLEGFIDEGTKEYKRPFAFKLVGQVATAVIHIQNLPKGTQVSSPEEAHQGQASYVVTNEESEIVGFFSTEHKGIFTHHDSFLHMHLITKDEQKMGHLDELEMGNMKLLLPKR